MGMATTDTIHDVKSAAAYLTGRGYTCSVGTVRALAKAGKLKCFRPGLSGRGPMRFVQARLDLFLHEAEFGPKTEPKPRAPKVASGGARLAPKAAPATAINAPTWKARIARELGK